MAITINDTTPVILYREDSGIAYNNKEAPTRKRANVVNWGFTIVQEKKPKKRKETNNNDNTGVALL